NRSYQDVAPGTPVALIGSAGLLEIAVRDGSAERELGIKVGDEVTWHRRTGAGRIRDPDA
ncbi:MAG: SAM hydroxide adenosyltransferase, partial [Tepidisphaeraceae bacterium]